MPKLVNLPPEAQRFLIPKPKAYYIKELKATIYATSYEDFERKRNKLLNRATIFTDKF